MPTLLLADDSVTIQRVIELTFASEDVRVVTTMDGASAIQYIDAEAPDIVLADVGMPRVDGYAVAAYVKQSPALREIPVLLLTGAFEPVDEDKARASGCDGVLVKPFEPQHLVGRVKELLAARRGPRLGPVPVPRPAAVSAMSPLASESRVGGRREAGDEETFRRELDQLDAACAQLDPESATTTEHESRPAEVARDPERDRAAASGAERGPGDWDLPKPPPQASDPLPVAAAGPVWFPAARTHAGGEPAREPASAIDQPPASPAAPVSRVAADARQGHPSGAPALTMAGAFSALLAAEKTNASHPSRSRVAISEAMMEEIVRRALARMTDDVVRRVVFETAERLVHEEIEKFGRSAD
jgi:CheY-like chemotaxis protein